MRNKFSFLDEKFPVNRELNKFAKYAKRIDSDQPESTQADLEQNLLLSVNFMHLLGSYDVMIHGTRMTKAKACIIFNSN